MGTAIRHGTVDRALSYSARRQRKIKTVVTYMFLIIAGLIFAFPLFWVMSGSLQTWMELRSYTPHLLPEVPQWQNYATVFKMTPFARWMLNSFLIIILAVPGGIISATLAAYAFARFPFKGRDVWFMIMLGTMMIPGHVTLIPQYLLFYYLKWINTYLPLTIPAWFGGGAFSIFLLRQFILSIPRDLDEAALIDGAGPFRILWQVLVPLMVPAITTLTILGFLGAWNDVMGPLIYLNKEILYTAALGLRFFAVTAVAGYAGTDPRDHLLMAGSVLMTVPVLIVFILAQRYFVQGVVLSGLKM